MSSAERLAVAERYLKGEGLTVLDRAYSCTAGSADFIAAEPSTLVVVLVLAKVPVSMSGPAKKRMRRVARDWMDSHGRRYDRVRVDVVAPRMEGTGGYTIEHVRAMA